MMGDTSVRASFPAASTARLILSPEWHGWLCSNELNSALVLGRWAG